MTILNGITLKLIMKMLLKQTVYFFKGKILQKSLGTTELDTYSFVNNWSNLKGKVHEKHKSGLNDT